MRDADPTELPPAKDLPRLAAERTPDGVAFADGVDGRSLTWDAFDARTNRAANALRCHVAQGDRVAFVCDASVDHVTLWTGALKAGCVVSNLHARAAPETLRHCVEALRPRVIVVDAAYSALVEEHIVGETGADPDAVVAIGEARADYERSVDAFLEGHSTTEPDVRVGEEDVMSVVWTSGTTGRPTGWCMTNRAFCARGWKLALVKRWSRHSRRVQPLTPSFAAWYTGVAPALFTGAATYFLRSWDPVAYLRTVDEASITHATLVPTMWRELVEHERFEEFDTSSLELVTAAGEVLDETTVRRLRERVCDRVTNAYASTEALGTAMLDEELTPERIESVGRAHPGTEVRVVEQGGPPDARLPPEEVGEVIVRGSDAVSWAWGDTATTEDAFRNGWWYSGDLGYLDADGFLFLEGRTDFVIYSKGMKVHPAPVEERLNAHPGVAESAVVGVEDDEYGERVVGVVHRADPDLTAGDLDEWCLDADALARYERPRAYRFVDEPLPRTATGKLDRNGARGRIE